MVKNIKKVGLNIKDLSKNLFKNEDNIDFDLKELNTLILASEMQEDSVLEKLSKSKDKEECKGLSLLIAVGMNINNKIANIKTFKDSCENTTANIDLTLEEIEFLLQGLVLLTDALKKNMPNPKDSDFEKACLQIAFYKNVSDKLAFKQHVAEDKINLKAYKDKEVSTNE